MSEFTPTALSEEERQELVGQLRRKEGRWLAWARACQALLKNGLNPQTLFEATGFEPIQQNQITVAMQVYDSILRQDPPAHVRETYQEWGSDLLYELRELDQEQRSLCAQLALERKLDADQIREVAKATKDFCRLPKQPDNFDRHPGDAVAYQCWRLAQERTDLTERSRLIARGLQFAQSAGARGLIEALLLDLSGVPSRKPPMLPIYRLETEEDLPRLLPFAGTLPLSSNQVEAIAAVEAEGPFGLVSSPPGQQWLALPGWQAILTAEDPIACLEQIDRLPNAPEGPTEAVVLVVDRAERSWDAEHFFLVEQAEGARIQWLPEAIAAPILGRLVLILRPKRVLDENAIASPWQFEE